MQTTNEYDYYKILGVDSSATPKQIREAFLQQRTQIPPALQTSTGNPAYRRLLDAFEVLNDPERRAIYDSLVAETAPTSLQIKIKSSNDKISLVNSLQVIYLLVDIRPPEQEETSHLPLNLSLVIDRSTSMQGHRLERVKAAVDLIINQLAPDDILSVVSFSDRAEVVLPATHVENKTAVLGRLRGIRASGGTEIYQGLIKGVEELEKTNISQHINHLLLLTDGHTYGDAPQCLELAHNMAVKNIGFSAFGIGSEWNDQFLDQLVAPSSGQSGYIEKPEQIIEYLQSRIKGLGSIYAQNLRFLPNFPPEISIRQGFKLIPFAQPLTLNPKEIKLGNVEGRSPLVFLLELNIMPQTMEKRINLPLHFVANLLPQQTEHTFKHNYELYILAKPPQAEPPKDIVKAVRMFNMYRMNERVWQEVEAGQLDMATKRMRHLTTRLFEAGEEQLAKQAQAESERLASMGMLSVEGRKRLKYGTRTLISQTMTLDIE